MFHWASYSKSQSVGLVEPVSPRSAVLLDTFASQGSLEPSASDAFLVKAPESASSHSASLLVLPQTDFSKVQ